MESLSAWIVIAALIFAAVLMWTIGAICGLCYGIETERARWRQAPVFEVTPEPEPEDELPYAIPIPPRTPTERYPA